MKALILVGGYGTRLRPLTLSVPKPIVEFANKAIVLHQIEALVAAGVNEVVLAVNYRPEVMESYLKEWEESLGIKITYSLEEVPLGTAGPLRLAAEILEETKEPFFVLNSDVICEFPMKDLFNFHVEHGHEGTICVTKVEEPSKYGVVITSEGGRVERFVEKPQKYVGNRINAGIYIFNPAILKRIPLRPTSIEKEIFPVMAEEKELYAFDLEGFWMDIGQPKDFLLGSGLYLRHLHEKHPEKLSKNSSGIIQPVLIDPSAQIGNDCCLGPNVVIGPNCVVGDGVRMKNSTLMKGCSLKSYSWISDCLIGWECKIDSWCRLDNHSVLGQDVHVKEAVFLNGALVLPHKTLNESVPKSKIIM